MEDRMSGPSVVLTDSENRPPGPRGHEIIRHENSRNYRKGPNYAPLKSLTGEGLLTSDGDYWLRQRRLVQPAFHQNHMEAISAVIADCTVEMLQRWQPLSQRQMLFDIEPEMHRLVMHIIGRILFSMNIYDQADMVSQAHTICIEHITRRIQRFGFPPESWPTPGNRRFQNALQALNTVIQDIITDRRKSGADTGDLLSLLLRVRDEGTGQRMTDRELRDELLSIFLAGFETTANALCWLWHLLATHLNITENLWAELAAVLGGRAPMAQDLPRLVYTRKVVDETLRLYPPVWLSARTPLQDDKIGRYSIPAGAIILFSPYVTHHHPGIWENPENFDPERFTKEQSGTRQRYAYIPFGGGPHLCIGHALAIIMMQMILATVAQVYRLDLASDRPVIPYPLVTLRPKHGLLVFLHDRGHKSG
jgi:cytochrome P450